MIDRIRRWWVRVPLDQGLKIILTIIVVLAVISWTRTLLGL